MKVKVTPQSSNACARMLPKVTIIVKTWTNLDIEFGEFWVGEPLVGCFCVPTCRTLISKGFPHFPNSLRLGYTKSYQIYCLLLYSHYVLLGLITKGNPLSCRTLITKRFPRFPNSLRLGYMKSCQIYSLVAYSPRVLLCLSRFPRGLTKYIGQYVNPISCHSLQFDTIY